MIKNYAKIRYYELKMLNLCVGCGILDASRGVYCEDCYNKIKALAQERRDRLKAQGLCIHCGKERATSYTGVCKVCHEAIKESKRKSYRRRKAIK